MRCKECNGEMISGFTGMYCKAECDLKVKVEQKEGYGGINCVLQMIPFGNKFQEIKSYLGVRIKYSEYRDTVEISSTLGELKKLNLKGLVGHTFLTVVSDQSLHEDEQLMQEVTKILCDYGMEYIRCTPFRVAASS